MAEMQLLTLEKRPGMANFVEISKNQMVALGRVGYVAIGTC